MRDVDNLAALVRRSAATGGAGAALRYQDRVITWAEFDAQVDAVADGLSRLLDTGSAGAGAGSAGAGAGPGQVDTAPVASARVAIALPNTAEFAVAFFATLRAGLVAVPINPGYTGRELRYVLADSSASVLIATPAVLDVLAGPASAVPSLDPPGGATVSPDLITFSVGAPTGGARPFADLLTGSATAGGAANADTATANTATANADSVGRSEDLAVLLYTSGTAGVPKGAMLSHRALLANHEQVARLDPPPVGPDDVVLLAVPFCHAYGLNSGLCAIAYHGACGVVVDRFDPADALDLISRHGVTVVIGVPPMVIAWSLLGEAAAKAFVRVRVVVSGAAPLDAADARRFSAVTTRAVQVGYGLTETAPVLTSTLASPYPKPGSVGRPIPGVELKLLDASGSEISLADDEADAAGTPGTPGTDPGEIVVRGANLFSGYWPAGVGGPGEAGWWATGDVAYADADGDLFLVDRLGELILVSGFNVYPHEVEAVLRAHPAVADAAALGVPDRSTGQTVRAYVVREPGAAVTAEEILAFAQRNLARFKCPTAVEFIAALPYSATGKIRKAALRGGVS